MKHLISFLFLFFIVFQNRTYAQVNNDVLVLTKISNNKKKVFKQDKKIKIWTNQNGEVEKYKGRYKIVNSEVIEIEGDTIKISEIDRLAVPSIGSRSTGTGLLIIGTATAAIGSILLVWAVNSDDYGAIIIGMIVGIPLIALGVIVDIVAIPFFFIKKKYDIDEDWDIKILPESSVK